MCGLNEIRCGYRKGCITMRNKKKNEEKKSKGKQIQLDREYFLKK